MGEGLGSEEVERLYLRYGFFLRRRCLLLLRDRALAEDALHEVFVKLIRGGAGVLAAEQPVRWLYRVADRACFDLLRRTKHTRRAKSLDDVDVELPPAADAEPDVRRAAIELLEALDDEEKSVAVMAFVDGMTQKEIADELGYSRMTIVKRVAAIRERAERLTKDRAPPRASTEGTA